MDKIEAVQRRVVRFIEGHYGRYSSVTQMQNSLSLDLWKQEEKDIAYRHFI